MGIINVTPDSFFAGSRKNQLNEIVSTAENMLQEGADFLDIGGYSSRPGADDMSREEELERVINPILAIKEKFPNAIISIDTFRSEVARKAVEAGAKIINDISAGHLDDKMLETVADMNVPYIAMHMRGTPQNMKEQINYDDLLKEVMFYFSEVVDKCNHLGIKDVVIDPGFGFAKNSTQSFHLLNHLEHLKGLDKPILVGVSRKSMIYRTLDLTADQALNGTTALNTLALFKGAAILRVHDIKEAKEVVNLINELN
ncbi:dihydropteroate synthase [Ochromonadaceae sp. CCMP2298]|nr:dihydropteroate synthase [Ochromonadaceae sp. CCMP2298]